MLHLAHVPDSDTVTISALNGCPPVRGTAGDSRNVTATAVVEAAVYADEGCVRTETPVGKTKMAADTDIEDVETSTRAWYGLSVSASMVCSSYCLTTTVYVTDTGPKRLLTVAETARTPELQECDDVTEAPLSTATETL